MTFKAVFISIFIGTSMIVAALVINAKRPAGDTSRPTAALVRATGKCAECHSRETSAIIHQFERSQHAKSNVNCLDCHRHLEGQEKLEHRGFTIAKHLTAKNCAECHSTEYNQFLKSRHAAPAWGAVHGDQHFTAEQISHAESFHTGMVSRPPNALALAEGPAAYATGCDGCHSIGKPNPDGSIGTCTACHARHSTSIALAREPQTCGQCHMGPDHSQIEIYTESKHGVLFNAQKASFDLSADPKTLSTRDMSVPTCATCHMSGLEGMKVTHDTTDRLSYFLYAAVSKKRPNFAKGQEEMKEVCLKCHTQGPIDRYYKEAEEVLVHVNEMVLEAQAIMKSLRDDGLLTPAPFDEPIEFLGFDYWHYWGRTAKHGAFMGGADFVQWHGNYELLAKLVELKEMDKTIRAEHAQKQAGSGSPDTGH